MAVSRDFRVVRLVDRFLVRGVWASLSLIALLLGVGLPLSVSSAPVDNDVSIGVLAYEGKQRTLARWQLTADYLSTRNPGYRFQIVPLFQSELSAAVREGRLDFVLTQPLQFVELSRKDGVWPLVTMSVRSSAGRLARFGSVIFVRSDRADLRHLVDLKGRVVAGATSSALGGWLLGLDAMSRAGLDPHTDIQPLFTGLPMQRVVQAVMEDRADAGVVRTGYLDQLVAEGRLSPRAFRVLDPRVYPGFPYVVSSELVPEWPFSATPHVSNHFAREVARQLLAMPVDSPAAKSGGIQKWALPLDYSTVQHIRDRWLPDAPSLIRVFQAYGLWLMLPIWLLIFLFFLQGRRTQKFLRAQEKRLRATLDALHDAVVVLSPAGHVQFANQSTQTLLRFPSHSLADLQGRHFSELFHMQWSGARPVDGLQHAIDLLAEQPEQEYEIQFLIGHQLREIDLRVSLLDGGGGTDQRTQRIILSMRDVTDYREATALLAYRASHDRLTGLMNRSAFEEFLENQCHSPGEKKSDGLILWVDVDDFRLINESNSREVGDQIIARLASHLSLALPTSGLIARLGADEFGIWIPDIQSISFRQWPEDLLTSLREWRFTVGTDRIRITLSIGVSMADYRMGAELLKDAEAACRRAYREGGNRVYWYTRDDQEIATRRHQLATLGQLKQALDNDGFCQVIQRILPTRASSGPRRDHYEVLLRVCDSAGNLQHPARFIEAAEKYHFMAEIDRWVIRKSFSFLAKITKKAPILAINLSGATVQDPQINPFIRAAFREFNLDPASICFEITETSAITNYDLVLELMMALRELGCSLALDDFGGGLLSFEFLRRLQPDYVKIDGKLIRDIGQDPVAEVIVSAIHQVTLVMGAQTIGEWVESEAIQTRLEEIGIHYVQGYLHHRPGPMTELLPDYSPT